MSRAKRADGPSLVILAAGMGSRFGGLKQVEPVGPNGELLIEYSIFDALSEGFRHIVFVIQRKQEDAFRGLLGRKLAGHCQTSIAYQELESIPAGFSVPEGRTKPWGTAHAVLAARDAVSGSFAVINADDYYGRPAYACIAAALRSGQVASTEFALVGFDLASTVTTYGAVSRGVCLVDSAGFLQRIDERVGVALLDEAPIYRDPSGTILHLPSDAIASMNMWAFPNTFFAALEEGFSDFLEHVQSNEAQGEYFLPSVVGHLIESRRVRVRVLRTRSTWMGVTYQEDMHIVKQRIGRLIEEGHYPHELWTASF